MIAFTFEMRSSYLLPCLSIKGEGPQIETFVSFCYLLEVCVASLFVLLPFMLTFILCTAIAHLVPFVVPNWFVPDIDPIDNFIRWWNVREPD